MRLVCRVLAPVLWMVAIAALLLLFCLAGTARAAGPEFGGCVRGGLVCFGPAAVLTLGKYQDGKFTAGAMPGACYEAVIWPDRWHSVGLSFCGQLEVGGASPNTGALSGLASFANWFRFGGSRIWIEQETGPAKGEWALLFGLGTMVGGSPKYVSEQGER